MIPDKIIRHMNDIANMLQEGRIHFNPSKVFDISELSQAMLYFSKGTHVGKIVVTYHDSTSLVTVNCLNIRT